MRFNWFSPVLPASTDIANYTARVAPALRQHAEVTLYTTQKKCSDETGVRQFEINSCDWKALNSADSTFYNIGNNSDFHAEIWEVSQQHAGIVILHDFALQHLFAGYFIGALKQPDRYVHEMQKQYGVRGLQAATTFLNGACNTETMGATFPFTGLAVADCLGIVVHTHAAYDALQEMSIVPVSYIPLPYRSSPPDVFARWMETRNVRSDTRQRLAVFGYLGPNRRLDAIFEALAGIPERDEFLLDIYGKVWDVNHVQKRIQQHGLESIVHLHGYVEDLDGKLASADLAINLRYPTMGEASGTQLRIWDHALPALVTDTGWYSELSRDAVAFVRPDTEVEDIRHHLRAFLNEPKLYERMGARGREILIREHSPETYASAIVEVSQQANRHCACAAWLRTADRVGEEMRRWLPPDAPEFIDRISAEISQLATPQDR